MVDGDPKLLTPNEQGIDNNSAHINTNRLITRDRRGKLRWRIPSYSQEENEQVGIRNIQGLFLERFPEFESEFIDGNGMVTEDKSSQAQSFILDNIGVSRKFIEVFGSSPLNSIVSPYFGGAYMTVLGKSFAQWGLDFEDRGSKLINFVQANGDILIIEAEQQRRGFEKIRDLLSGKMSFAEVTPFTIDEYSGHPKARDSFLVAVVGGKQINLHANDETRQVLDTGGEILVIPKQDDKNLYQWLELYEVRDGASNSQSLVQSSRVLIDSLNLDSQYWTGPEKQVFLDFLGGKDEIEGSDLREFRATLSKKRILNIGFIGSKKVKIYVGNPLCTPGCKIISRSRFNSERELFFLEGYVVDTYGKEQQVYTRRFSKGDINLYKTSRAAFRFEESASSDIHIFNEWLTGVLPFEKAVPVSIQVTEGTRGISLGKRFISFNSQVKPGDKLLFLPKKDTVYEWFEVIKRDTGQAEGDVVLNSYRIHREKGGVRLDSHWPGTERQRLVDYLDSKLSSSELTTIPAICEGIGINLFNYKNKRLRLWLARDIVSQGDKLIIVPRFDDNGNLILEVSKEDGNSILRRFILDRKDLAIRALPDNLQEINLATVPRVDESGKFVDKDNELWAPIGYFHQAYNLDYKTVYKYTKGISRVMVGMDQIGRFTELYSETDVSKALEQIKGVRESEKDLMESISAEEADADLDKFLL